MAITACPVTPTFAAEIGDVDLSRKIDPNDLAAYVDARKIADKYAKFRSRNSSRNQPLRIR